MRTAVLLTEFAGKRGRLFWLVLKMSVLTVLTLGLYRFWMKTRLRRWYWSSVRPGGYPFEYVGEPIEKLLGFLIAVVFLAFYLGIVNLAFMFGSLALFESAQGGYAVWFLGLLPFLFFARYRSRRYILARTRWRGLRFGLEPGAWGYTLRALWYWVLTLLTLGLYWPVMAFKLEKFRTDRTWYGTAQLHQDGANTLLYPAAAHLLIGVVITLATLLLVAAGETGMSLLLAISLPWSFFGLIYWRVERLRLLTNFKTIGQSPLLIQPRVERVARIVILGTLAILGVFTMAFMLLGMIFVGLGLAFAVDLQLGPERFISGLPPLVTALYGVVTYIIVMLIWGVLSHVFLTMPLVRHYAETLVIGDAPAFARVFQRDRDAVEGADGFAEAMDVGAAI